MLSISHSDEKSRLSRLQLLQQHLDNVFFEVTPIITRVVRKKVKASPPKFGKIVLLRSVSHAVVILALTPLIVCKKTKTPMPEGTKIKFIQKCWQIDRASMSILTHTDLQKS